MKAYRNILLLILFGTYSFGALQEQSLVDKLCEKYPINTTTNDLLVLSDLLIHIFHNHITKCVPIFLYEEETYEYLQVIEEIIKRLDIPIMHGWISEYNVKKKFFGNNLRSCCYNYVLFLTEANNYKNMIGQTQSVYKVILITKLSQWKINEFLVDKESRNLINLLVIAPSSRNRIEQSEPSYVLYMHELYVDGIGSSAVKVLASWKNGSLTKKNAKLFSKTVKNGFSGHRFRTSVAHRPPFIIRRGLDENDNVLWDGIEIRVLKLLASLYNFTIDIKGVEEEPHKSGADCVADNIQRGVSNVGLSGIYLTQEHIDILDASYPHSYDCAAFISLTSTALPRNRAIMGPFHWTVWLTLTCIYLFAIFLLVFADKHTLKHLIKNPEKLEYMFWYVLGTFTNCFTFRKESWTKSSKITPRLLMGFYWIFTTIITACYTGSIIAFMTLPKYPNTVDTVRQLLDGGYQIGTLNRGGWEHWFSNTSDIPSQMLLKKIELLPNIESGLVNITKAFFWPYAFLGSRAQLNYIVQTNFTSTNKRSFLHISSECFVPFGVSMIFPKDTIYRDILDRGISQIIESGLMQKFEQDIKWDFMRSPTGKLLQANARISLRTLYADDRSLSLDDTQGIFLMLGVGYLFGLLSVVLENVNGCCRCFKKRRLNIVSITSSNPREIDTLSAREILNLRQYSGSPKNKTEAGEQSEKANEINKIANKSWNLDYLFGEENVHCDNQNLSI